MIDTLITILLILALVCCLIATIQLNIRVIKLEMQIETLTDLYIKENK